jgi:hypothetical protein|tara:strand:- start:7 stop:243 length:237 start_codon:yes stop_codon:yes gene_type:complete
MDAMLSFDLPEDNFEFQCAINGVALRRSICDFQEYMRQMYKYNERISDAEKEMIQHLREQFQEMLEGNGVIDLVNSPD